MMTEKKTLSKDKDWYKIVRIAMGIIGALGFVFISWQFGLFSGW